MEANKVATPVLDLKQLQKLRSLQLYDNPLEYLPELSVCDELRSLSFTQLRVWSDKNYTKFEVISYQIVHIQSGESCFETDLSNSDWHSGIDLKM